MFELKNKSNIQNFRFMQSENKLQCKHIFQEINNKSKIETNIYDYIQRETERKREREKKRKREKREREGIEIFFF